MTTQELTEILRNTPRFTPFGEVLPVAVKSPNPIANRTFAGLSENGKLIYHVPRPFAPKTEPLDGVIATSDVAKHFLDS